MRKKLGRLLGADEGWGGALGTLLLLGSGVFILFISMADLREAARLEPVERGCAEWLADPSGARWVKLVGCRLDLREAASRKWKGWRSTRDGGVNGEHYLELFIPVGVGEMPNQQVQAVVATSDKPLLDMMDTIDRLEPAAVDAYLEANADALRALLEPATLTGYVEPVKSLAARSALGVLMASDAVVLEQGRRPPRANAIFGVVMGCLAVAWGVRTIVRRVLLMREE